MEGLEEFNYVWILFIFHLDLGEQSSEEAKGMFANRDTHRMNPIGMTLAHLDKIDGKTLFLSGIDAINGSPVVDIKPYHYKDAVSAPPVESEAVLQGLETKFIESALEGLKEIVERGKLDFYEKIEDAQLLIEQVL